MAVAIGQSNLHPPAGYWQRVRPAIGQDGVTPLSQKERSILDEKYVEMAEALENSQRSYSVANSSAKALPDTDLTPDQYVRTDCEECGDDLPVFRMQKGCHRCTLCQTIFERPFAKGSVGSR